MKGKLKKRKLAQVYEFYTMQISEKGKVRDKKGYYIIKGVHSQKMYINLHVYMHNNGEAKYTRLKLTECKEKWMNPLLQL